MEAGLPQCFCFLEDISQTVRLKHHECLRHKCLSLNQSLNYTLSNLNILNFICLYRDEDALNIVLEYGAFPNLKDSQGRLPLESAVRENWTKGVKLLLKAGAEIIHDSIFAVNFLKVALQESYPEEEIISALVEAGSKPEHDYLSSIYYRRRWCLETTSIFMAILRRRLRIPSPSFPQGYPLPLKIIQEMGKRVWATRQDTSIWYICKSFQNKKN